MLSEGMTKLMNSLSCCTFNGAQYTHVLIKETDPQAVLKKVTLKIPNGDWFSFEPDKGRGREARMSPLLAASEHHHHHRACDCVIVMNCDGKLTIVYIDLKSNNPSGYAGQFKSTRQFVRYALGLLKEFHCAELGICEERYVVLYSGKPMLLNKTTTVPKLGKIRNTKPDDAYKRRVNNSDELNLNELLR
ncbi:MAG: hypothetical protein LBQ81_01635 [Zoogloeaceae bacterium]|jgi:hypothetical protein|nr:hypothetical protein [Zoogloeaceae bacterium]